MARKNYHQILTELFQQYNPAKVKEVDALLTQFAGREEELVRKIHLKYTGQVPQSPTAGPESEPLTSGPQRKKPSPWLVAFLVLVLLGTGAWWAADQGWLPGFSPSEELYEQGAETRSEDEAMEKEPVEDEETEPDSGSMEARFSAPPMEYGVQVGLFSDPENKEIFKRLGERRMDLNVLPTEEGHYMYVVGNDLELERARERRDELRKIGFPDAFVVGLRKGKRVEIRPGE